MNEKILDNRGRVLAYIKDEGDSLRLYDHEHKTLGHYSKTRDVTMTKNFRIIGSGQQLGRLIPSR